MRRLVVTAALMIAASVAARPAPAAADPAYSACTDRARTNPDFAACGGAYLKRADAAMNVAWKATLAALQPASKAELLKEQRAWLTFRDASCNLYTTGDFGREGEVIQFFACRGALVEARTAALKAMAAYDR